MRRDIAIDKTLTEPMMRARMEACRRWKWANYTILSMYPIQIENFGTMAVDQYWRLYYDAKWAATVNPDALAGTILHEAVHITGRHIERMQLLLPPAQRRRSDSINRDTWRMLNIAFDLAVNSMLERECIALPEGAVYPKMFGYKSLLSGEEYFRIMRREKQTLDQLIDHLRSLVPPETVQGLAGSQLAEGGQGQGQQQGDGQGQQQGGGQGQQQGDGQGQQQGKPSEQPGNTSVHHGWGIAGKNDAPQVQPTAPGCIDMTTGETGGGSCADGVSKDFEYDSPRFSGVDGYEEYSQNQVVWKTLKEYHEQVRGQGSGAGGGGYQAIEMRKANASPETALRTLLSGICIGGGGLGSRTFRRPNRRSEGSPFILPAHYKPTPSLALLIDSSGSMSSKKLAIGKGVVERVCKRMQVPIDVYTGGTRLETRQRKMRGGENVTISDGGGTALARMTRQVIESGRKYHAVIVVTDCEDFGWKSSNKPQGDTKYICYAMPCSSSYLDLVPAWFDAVVVDSEYKGRD